MTKHLLGVDIGGTKTAIVYARLDGDIQIADRLAFPTKSVSETINLIISGIESVAARNGVRPADFQGIGISCGGPLDSRRGLILSPPNLPGWDSIPIVQTLSERFHVPCAIQNDANACALAEWRFGAGRGTRNMVFLTFGTGLGAGLIIDGKLYSGTNDNAGEVGHVRLSEFGPVGYGKQGSFEGFASGGGIAQIARVRLAEEFQRGRKVEWCKPGGASSVTARLVAE